MSTGPYYFTIGLLRQTTGLYFILAEYLDFIFTKNLKSIFGYVGLVVPDNRLKDSLLI